MANKLLQFTLDTELDSDIFGWIESFPRSRKSEMVRTAIRTYMAMSNTGQTQVIVQQAKKTEPKRPKAKDLDL